VLYRLPKLVKYPSGTAFLCEGEKDSDRVATVEFCECSTTVASGAWHGVDIAPLRGRDVIVVFRRAILTP
jgi:hypothetical protein